LNIEYQYVINATFLLALLSTVLKSLTTLMVRINCLFSHDILQLKILEIVTYHCAFHSFESGHRVPKIENGCVKSQNYSIFYVHLDLAKRNWETTSVKWEPRKSKIEKQSTSVVIFPFSVH